MRVNYFFETLHGAIEHEWLDEVVPNQNETDFKHRVLVESKHNYKLILELKYLKMNSGAIIFYLLNHWHDLAVTSK